MQSIFLKGGRRDLQLGCLFSTTHPVIRSVQMMHFRQEICQKILQQPHRKGGARMRNTVLPNGEMQSFYYEDNHPTMPGWFKGMEELIRERNLLPATGLQAQCEGFKCVPGKTDCCCRRILFTQPDFVA